MADEASVLQPGKSPGGALSLDEIVGQVEAVQRLRALIQLVRSQDFPLPHILLVGRPGTGKRTLAMALARELGVAIVTTAGRSLERGGDLIGILANLNERDVLFLEDVPSLTRVVVEEVLSPAMEEFSFTFVMDKGLNTRTMQIPLRPFTCIGTAARASDVPESLRSRFTVVVELQPYSEVEVGTIVGAWAKKRGLDLPPDAAALVAQASDRELQRAKAILDLAGQPLTRRLEVADISKALAILGHKPRAVGDSPFTADDVAQLTGPQFETWIGTLLERFGFRATVTQASGDGGIDIVAILDRLLIGGRYLVQCKRYAPDALVGVPAVREFYGTLVADRGAVKGLFITTSAFTAQAREFAKTLPIELIDGPTLRALLEGLGGRPDEAPPISFTPRP